MEDQGQGDSDAVSSPFPSCTIPRSPWRFNRWRRLQLRRRHLWFSTTTTCPARCPPWAPCSPGQALFFPLPYTSPTCRIQLWFSTTLLHLQNGGCKWGWRSGCCQGFVLGLEELDRICGWGGKTWGSNCRGHSENSDGGFFSLSHLRRAVPPPPPPSATGTVGADVPPASGRDQVGGQQGPSQGVYPKAGRATCPEVGACPTVITTDSGSVPLTLPWGPLRQGAVMVRMLLPPDYYDAESL